MKKKNLIRREGKNIELKRLIIYPLNKKGNLLFLIKTWHTALTEEIMLWKHTASHGNAWSRSAIRTKKKALFRDYNSKFWKTTKYIIWQHQQLLQLGSNTLAFAISYNLKKLISHLPETRKCSPFNISKVPFTRILRCLIF